MAIDEDLIKGKMMPRIPVYIILSYLIMLLGVQLVCADTFVHDDLKTDPAPSEFNICHGGTCENIADVSLNQEQWRLIKDIFKNNQTAEKELNNIRRAIATMEMIVGKLTDTYNDKAENISDTELNHYMDCIDESTNTSIYMMMMKRQGLIRWHTVEDRATRGFFIYGWPHTTAVIKDTRTEELYAVDSWFLDNGKRPFIIPLDEWFKGWRP